MGWDPAEDFDVRPMAAKVCLGLGLGTWETITC